MGKPIAIRGMHGLGDNIRSRALIRDLIANDFRVTLSTPWPSVFYDFVAARRLTLAHSHSEMRTQRKNERRESMAYSDFDCSHTLHHIWYPANKVIKHGSILAAMYDAIGMNPLASSTADFTLPVADSWYAQAMNIIGPILSDPRPVLVYRPLQARREWTGCQARNPDFNAYAGLYGRLRGRFCVVSVADLEDGEEWLVGKDFDADYYFHRGELSFEVLAVLFQHASLVYTAPGFGGVLAQAIGTPYVIVFGGYENSRFWPHGRYMPPSLMIDTIHPCECFKHDHKCSKKIDMHVALGRLDAFVDSQLGGVHAAAA